MQTDTERQAAILELMAMPDPPDLEPRCHVLTVEGHPQRFELIQDLRSIAAEYRRQELRVQ